jgi:hypothetical protein
MNVLLHATNFEGNVPRMAKAPKWDWEGLLPRLRFTRPEYLAAYGLNRRRDGRFHRGKEVRALADLRSLADPKTICFLRPTGNYKRGERTYSGKTIKTPLIILTKFYQDIPEREAEILRRNSDLDIRVTHIEVDFAPIWFDQIANRFLLKPLTLYEEIRRFNRGRKFPPAVYGLADYVLSFDYSPIVVNRETLECRLWLDRHRKQEHPERAIQALDLALRTVAGVGLLDRFEFNGLRSVAMFQNLERCRRVRQQPHPDRLLVAAPVVAGEL